MLPTLVATVQGPRHALPHGERALRIAKESQDLSLEWRAHFGIGMVLLWLGRYREALPSLLRAREWASSKSEDATKSDTRRGISLATRVVHQVWMMCGAAWCLAERGNFDDALENANESLRIAEVSQRSYPRGTAYEFVGFVHLRQGNIAPAISLLQKCLEISRSADIPVFLEQMAFRLGYAYVLARRIPEAISVLEAGKDAGDATRNMVWVPMTHAHLGHAYALAGRFDEALRTIQHAIDLTVQFEERAYEAWARYLAGCVHALRKDAKAAEEAYTEAHELARELEMRPLVSQCDLGLGELHAAFGKIAKAREHLALALPMFREMGIDFWSGKAEAAIGELA